MIVHYTYSIQSNKIKNYSNLVLNMSRHYSFLQEIANLTPARNAESEVGDPIGGVDRETEATRRKAKSIKAQTELLAATAQLKKTKFDADRINKDIANQQEEERNAEIDKQRQQQQQQQAEQQAQQQAQAQANDINSYVNQQVGIPQQTQQPVQQDPTMDPNAQ